jgi:hypothetical protein
MFSRGRARGGGPDAQEHHEHDESEVATTDEGGGLANTGARDLEADDLLPLDRLGLSPDQAPLAAVAADFALRAVALVWGLSLPAPTARTPGRHYPP